MTIYHSTENEQEHASWIDTVKDPFLCHRDNGTATVAAIVFYVDDNPVFLLY